MVIYFKLYLVLWNNIRFYNKNYIIVSFNKELLWMLVFVVILDRVIMVWVVFVKFLGYRDVFDFFLDRMLVRFVVILIIDDELICCWFLRDFVYKNIEKIFFLLEVSDIRIIYVSIYL